MPLEPTNVLFIMSDQHSRHVLGCSGNAVAFTPNLDALAARGTCFCNAYCNFPICVPSRASFATGRYAHALRSWDNAAPYVGTEAPSWGHRLTGQGHHVTTVGKLHYRRVDDPSGFPDQRLPMQYAYADWPRHPVLEAHRRRQALDEPFDEATVRNALAAYYGLVSFMDQQVGVVLDALAAAGLQSSTRVVYTSDHGDMLGEHGLWWKSSMYEGSVGVPLILAGPGVPEDHVVQTNVSLVDCFPTIVEAVGAQLRPEDANLPGASLWQLAREPDRVRTVFSEYHAIFSASGEYMLRTGRHKYVAFLGSTPQLFDLERDPDELHDLTSDPAYASVVAACDRELRGIVDPEEVDRQAKADQRRKIEAAGGVAAVIAGGVKIPYTPAPQWEVPRPPRGQPIPAP